MLMFTLRHYLLSVRIALCASALKGSMLSARTLSPSSGAAFSRTGDGILKAESAGPQ